MIGETRNEILKPDLGLVYERVRGDLAGIAAESPGYEDLCHFVAEDLIERLEDQSRKPALMRTVVRYAGAGVLAALAAAYLGAFWWNDLTVEQPIETKAGLIQQAAAFEKARTYSDWADSADGVRRGGAIAGLVLWPLQPDDAEQKAAEDFAGLSLNGLQTLTAEGVTCNTEALLAPGEFLTEPQLGFVDEVAAHLQAKDTAWQDPPIMTLLPLMVERHACTGAALLDPEASPPTP
jgi:hypothetical protein